MAVTATMTAVSTLEAAPGSAARVAVFSKLPAEFKVLQGWVQKAGYELSVVVTRPTKEGLEVVVAADPGAVVLVTPRTAACAGILAEANVDAGVVCGYGKLPVSLVERTRHGIVNLHPALLPEYPGPNPRRALFEGEGRLGYTMHRIVEELDAGPILAQAAFDVPAVVDPDAIGHRLHAAMLEVLDAGMPRVLADDPGEPQGPGSGTVAVPFSEAETELSWDLPARTLQVRATALLMAGFQPRALVEGSLQPIRRLWVVDGLLARRPGVVRARGRRALVGVADGVVEVALGELPD